MINIGITGANGFIGWHLSSKLKLRNDQFNVVDFDRNWFNDSDKLNNDSDTAKPISNENLNNNDDGLLE